MNILIVNDDGINSPSLRGLASKLAKKYKVLVVAPKNEMSACSHSLSIKRKILVEKEDFDNVEAYSITGSTADCVKFALVFLNYQVDLLFSGINIGANVGTDIIYSGTLAGAREGAINNLKSIALSKQKKSNENFEYIYDYVYDNINTLVKLDYNGVFYNINFPNIHADKVKGVKVCKVGDNQFEDKYFEFEDGYILDGHESTKPMNKRKTDVEYLKEGYITISPVIYKFSDPKLIKKAKAVLDV